MRNHFWLGLWILGLSACQLPQPPGSQVVRKQEVFGPHALEWIQMKPIYRDAGGKHGMLQKRKSYRHGRNLVFVAVDELVQHQFSEAISQIYEASVAPRVEDIFWWALAPQLQKVYDVVIRIPWNRANPDALMQAMDLLEKRGKPFDVVLMTHGAPNALFLSPKPRHLWKYPDVPERFTLSYKRLQKWQGRYRNLDLVYLQACWGSSLKKDWLQVGARTVISYDGEYRNFFYPGIFYQYLIRYGVYRHNPVLAYQLANRHAYDEIRRGMLTQKVIATLGMSFEQFMEWAPNPEIVLKSTLF